MKPFYLSINLIGNEKFVEVPNLYFIINEARSSNTYENIRYMIPEEVNRSNDSERINANTQSNVIQPEIWRSKAFVKRSGMDKVAF